MIFSAVRSTKGRSKHARIGFVADERRLNVGLTRARASLLVIGNFKALRSDAKWKALVQHAKDTGCGLPEPASHLPKLFWQGTQPNNCSAACSPLP